MKDNHEYAVELFKDPVPDARTKEYYKKRPCVELVKCAAKIVDEVLKEKEVGPC